MSVLITGHGPTALRDFAFPDVNAKILTSAAPVTVPEGGTGVATLASRGVLVGRGTGAIGVTAAGAVGQVLQGAGAGADPTWGAVPSVDGVWTPSLGGTATYATQIGTYVKIGRLVFIQLRITVTVLGTGSASQISGLPFAAAEIASLAVGLWQSLTGTWSSVSAYTGLGATTINMAGNSAVSASQINPASVFGNGAIIFISGCYQT